MRASVLPWPGRCSPCRSSSSPCAASRRAACRVPGCRSRRSRPAACGTAVRGTPGRRRSDAAPTPLPRRSGAVSRGMDRRPRADLAPRRPARRHPDRCGPPCRWRLTPRGPGCHGSRGPPCRRPDPAVLLGAGASPHTVLPLRKPDRRGPPRRRRPDLRGPAWRRCLTPCGPACRRRPTACGPACCRRPPHAVLAAVDGPSPAGLPAAGSPDARGPACRRGSAPAVGRCSGPGVLHAAHSPASAADSAVDSVGDASASLSVPSVTRPLLRSLRRRRRHPPRAARPRGGHRLPARRHSGHRPPARPDEHPDPDRASPLPTGFAGTWLQGRAPRAWRSRRPVTTRGPSGEP